MTDFAFIDNFLKMELTPEEITLFEQKVNSDAGFAEEVAFYLSTMHVLKEQSAEEKKKHFRKIYEEAKLQHTSNKPVFIRKTYYYITAAAIAAALVAGYFFYFQPVSSRELADQYINQQFISTMGVKMDAKADSLDRAMVLYNEGKLPEALQLFASLAQKDHDADIPKKMAGVVCLRLEDYDKALKYFIELEQLTLYTNPGKLYHALTLMKRDAPGDQKSAKQLLQQVVDKNLEGKETAQQWMKSF